MFRVVTKRHRVPAGGVRVLFVIYRALPTVLSPAPEIPRWYVWPSRCNGNVCVLRKCSLAADVVIDVIRLKTDLAVVQAKPAKPAPADARADQFRRRSDGPILVWAAKCVVAHRMALALYRQYQRAEIGKTEGATTAFRMPCKSSFSSIAARPGLSTAFSSESHLHQPVISSTRHRASGVGTLCIQRAVAFVDAHKWRVPGQFRQVQRYNTSKAGFSP